MCSQVCVCAAKCVWYFPSIHLCFLLLLLLLLLQLLLLLLLVRENLQFMCKASFLSHFSFLNPHLTFTLRACQEPLDLTDMANAASGMAVADDCKVKFLELQRKKTFRYLIFKIDEKSQEVVVEKAGDPPESYDDFTALLPENECRYAVYDFDFLTDDNCRKSKIFFIAWSPDTSSVKAKMIYASSKDSFRKELDGVHYELQATDRTEMDIEVIKERAN